PDEAAPPHPRLVLTLPAQDHLHHGSGTDDVAAVRLGPGDAPPGEPLEQRRGQLVAEVQPMRVLPPPPEHPQRCAHDSRFLARRTAPVRAGPATGTALTAAASRARPVPARRGALAGRWVTLPWRSEERRVGNGGRSRGWWEH